MGGRHLLSAAPFPCVSKTILQKLRQERGSPQYNLIFKFCLCVFSFQFTNFEQLFLETGNSMDVLSMMFNILQPGCSHKMLTYQMLVTKTLLL